MKMGICEVDQGWLSLKSTAKLYKMKDYLFETITVYNQNVEKFAQAAAGKEIRAEIEHFAALVPSEGYILEIGCAQGRDAALYHAMGFNITGIDLSEAFIKQARLNVPEVFFEKMDARHLMFPDRNFDGIWAAATFLHLTLPDMRKALKEAWRVLKPGGHLFMSMKKGKGSREVADNHTVIGKRFFTFVEQDELSEIVRKVGFTVLTSYVVNEREVFGKDMRDLDWICLFAQKPTLPLLEDHNIQSPL